VNKQQLQQQQVNNNKCNNNKRNNNKCNNNKCNNNNDNNNNNKWTTTSAIITSAINKCNNNDNWNNNKCNNSSVITPIAVTIAVTTPIDYCNNNNWVLLYCASSTVCASSTCHVVILNPNLFSGHLIPNYCMSWSNWFSWYSNNTLMICFCVMLVVENACSSCTTILWLFWYQTTLGSKSNLKLTVALCKKTHVQLWLLSNMFESG
jgi:hypothetical protein